MLRLELTPRIQRQQVREEPAFTGSEISESKEQHDRWFSENIGGVIPGVELQVIKVHAVVTP